MMGTIDSTWRLANQIERVPFRFGYRQIASHLPSQFDTPTHCATIAHIIHELTIKHK